MPKQRRIFKAQLTLILHHFTVASSSEWSKYLTQTVPTLNLNAQIEDILTNGDTVS